MTKIFFIFISMFSIFNLSYAQEYKEVNIEPEVIIEEVLELSGMEETIKQMQAQFDTLITQYKWDMSPDDYEKFYQEMTELNQADKLHQGIVEYLKNNFDHDRFLTVLQWLRSPLSKKMTQLVVQASMPERMQELRDYTTYLESNPPTQERLAIVQRLDSNPCVPSKGIMLYIFRSVSDEELAQYIDFWSSDIGKWFGELLDEAQWQTLDTIEEELDSRAKEKNDGKTGTEN